MANIIALKRRIQAATNVSKTTKAMQMIAASKLKKAQTAALSSRPYVEKLTTLTQNIASKIDKEEIHPYMKKSLKSEKTLLILFAPDKGLCGSLVTNLMREFLKSRENTKTVYIAVGKKIESQITYVKNEIIAAFPFGTTLPTFDMVYPIARIIEDNYLSENVFSVKILYTHFTSVFTQNPKIATLLPIEISLQTDIFLKNDALSLFEPDVKTILPSLLEHYLEMSIYQYLLESFVSEQASRMMAMQNATSNAKEIIEELKLEYNKTRQAKITNDILDITNTGTKSQ